MARKSATTNEERKILAQEDRRWFLHPVNADVHEQVVSHGKTLLSRSESRHSKNRARNRIYEGHELVNNRAAIVTLDAAGIAVAKLNASKSIIDTFASRLAKDRPMPSFVTDDADWDLKEKAKKYRQFIVGEMRNTEFDDLSRDAVLDGAVFGNAFTRIDNTENDVYAERMLVNEMLFDDRELKYGKPHQAIKVTRMSRDYLRELFPEDAEAIKRCPGSVRRADDTTADMNILGDLDDYVDVFEAWHPPTTKDSDDGRRALCIETCTFVFEKWHEPRFPWAHLRLHIPREGFWGFGFIDQLASLQHRINCIVRDIQLNLAATGRGHFLVTEQNDIPVEMLTGWQPFKLKYKGGTPPVFQTPTPFNQAQLNALEFFIRQMYELTGVSQAAASSKSALGPGASGVALDTQYDIDSDRFRMPQGNYARYRLNGSQCYIDAAARVARKREESKGEKRSYVAVSWKNRDAIERLDYSKVCLEEGQYRLQIEAVNFLPDTRAGKLAIVQQLAQAGVIPQWIVPSLFDEPDLVQANNITLAPYRNCLRKMDDICDPKLPLPVAEAYNDLDLELKMSTAYFNHMQNERAPEGIQQRYRDYIDIVVEAIKNKTAKAAMPDGVMTPGAAPALPGGPMLAGMPQMAPVPPAPAPLPPGAPVATA